MGAHQQRIADAVNIGGGSYTSDPIGMRGVYRASFQNTWTGTPTGTITLQGSNHRLAVDRPSEATWTTLTVSLTHGTANPAGSASNNLIVVINPPRWVRLVYAGAGAGGLSVDIDLDDAVD